MKAKLAIGAGIAVVATLIGSALAITPFVQRIELATYDWRLRQTARPTSPSGDIVIVSIDDDSVRRMEPHAGRWPWPRLYHAALIDFLRRAPAKLVVYDILFTESDRSSFTVADKQWTGAQSDRAFADAIAESGNVILAADARPEELIDPTKELAITLNGIPSLDQRFAPGDCFERRPRLVPPVPELAAAARALGHSFAVLDSDGPVRRMVPFVRIADRYVPSLPVAAALLAQGLPPASATIEEGRLRIGATGVPLVEQEIPRNDGGTDRACRALVSFRGPVRSEGISAFKDYSFYDLFEAQYYFDAGKPPPPDRGRLVDPSEFKNKIVVVGATAAALFDVFTTPLPGNTPAPQIHANAIDALLTGRTLEPARSSVAFAGTLGLALIVGGVGALVSPWILSAVALALSGLVVWLSVQWFAGGLWTPLVQPLLAIALAFVGQLAWQYFVEGREKRRVKRLFSRYVPKDVYDQLIEDPARAALGGRRRTMTVLFSDVRGFTAMSEKASPEQVVGQLNEYFSRMVQVLFEHHGTLDKFVGDMVMGLFSAPLDDPDHADHAVQAALAMTRALDDLNAEWRAAGRPELDIGIGISTGDMVAGNIGSETIMSYTVIGDTVNLGARLESLNKEYGTRIIISEATRAALQGRYETRPLGEVVVKGKSQPVAIYEVKQS